MEIWEPKTPGETVLRRWEPALPHRESLTGEATVSVDDGTVTASAVVTTYKGNDVVEVLIAGGAAGETARISVDVATSEGETRTGVFFIAVRAEAPVLGTSAQDICAFALRKVVGNGTSPSADELADALERLNDMLMLWRINGLDVGLAGALDASDVLDIPDVLIAGIKYCLLLDIHDFYGVPLTQREATRAEQAEAAMRAYLLTFEDLNFDRGLLRRPGGWDFMRGF